MLCMGDCKFLGVAKGHNDKGDYFRINLFDPSGDSLRLYCAEEVYNAGMLIPFGKECTAEFNIRSFSGRNYVSVESILEHE